MRHILLVIAILCLFMSGCNTINNLSSYDNSSAESDLDSSDYATSENKNTLSTEYVDDVSYTTEAKECLQNNGSMDVVIEGIYEVDDTAKEICLYYNRLGDVKYYYLHDVNGDIDSNNPVFDRTNDIFVAESLENEKIEVVVDDITLDGHAEIIIRFIKNTTSGICSDLKIYETTKDNIFEELSSKSSRNRTFLVERNMDITKISCADLFFEGYYQDYLYYYSFGYNIKEGETIWELEPRNINIVEYCGEKALEYTYSIGLGNYISICEIVSLKNGKEHTLAILADTSDFVSAKYLGNYIITDDDYLYNELNKEDHIIYQISEIVNNSEINLPYLIRVFYYESQDNYSINILFESGDADTLILEILDLVGTALGESFINTNKISVQIEGGYIEGY